MTDILWTYLIWTVVPIVIIVTLPTALIWYREKLIKNKIRSLANSTLEITPKEFFAIRNSTLGRPKVAFKHDFEGIYILYNKNKNMYYVGQGRKVFSRVNNHFTGKGNGDVYADFKYGDNFSIKMISLNVSGFKTLNELEKNTILTYNAYTKGYNKTRGNQR